MAERVVVRAARTLLAHAPGLVRYGSKPIRAQLPPAVYEEQIGLADAVLDTGAIRDAPAELRAAAGATREETA